MKQGEAPRVDRVGAITQGNAIKQPGVEGQPVPCVAFSVNWEVFEKAAAALLLLRNFIPALGVGQQQPSKALPAACCLDAPRN